MIRSTTLSLKTSGFSDIRDITGDVRSFVSQSGLRNGIINLFVIGSTASISTIEFEPSLVADMKDRLDWFAPSAMRTRHGDTWGDDNGFSHLRATMMGPGIVVPLSNGEPVLGTWQQIVLIDHDNRPRTREIFMQILGE